MSFLAFRRMNSDSVFPQFGSDPTPYRTLTCRYFTSMQEHYHHPSRQ